MRNVREKWRQSQLYEKLQRLKKDMEPMSFWEKIGHLWYCYKIYFIVIFVIVAMLGSIMGTAISYQMKDRLVSGMLVNVYLDQRGMNYLTSEYEQYLGAKKGQEVELESVYFGKLTEYSPEDDYSKVLVLTARVEGKMLDYAILDRDGLDTAMRYDMFLDLREFFTQEELDKLAEEDRLFYAMVEGDEDRWPVAVKITDIPFVKDNVKNKGEIFFTLSGREPDLEMCRNAWDYIHAWKSKTE